MTINNKNKRIASILMAVPLLYYLLNLFLASNIVFVYGFNSLFLIPLALICLGVALCVFAILGILNNKLFFLLLGMIIPAVSVIEFISGAYKNFASGENVKNIYVLAVVALSCIYPYLVMRKQYKDLTKARK